MATIKMIAAAASGCSTGVKISWLTRPDRAAVDALPQAPAIVLAPRLARPPAMQMEEIFDLLGQASRGNGSRTPQRVRE